VKITEVMKNQLKTVHLLKNLK